MRKGGKYPPEDLELQLTSHGLEKAILVTSWAS